MLIDLPHKILRLPIGYLKVGQKSDKFTLLFVDNQGVETALGKLIKFWNNFWLIYDKESHRVTSKVNNKLVIFEV